MIEKNFLGNPEAPKKEKIIITGGTEGIGKAIAEQLLKEEKQIAICARTQEKIDEMNEKHESLLAYQLDLADRWAAKEFVQDSMNKLGGVDVLILNAAVTGMSEEAGYVFKVNEIAPVVLSLESSKALRESHGRIVFLTSAAKNIEGAEAYGESKRRIEEWLIDFSNRPENKDIQIFSVIPGSCDTEMHKDILVYGQGEAKARTEKIIAEGKLRDPQTIGKIISKMSISGNKFNSETSEYDTRIGQCEVVVITDDNIRFEESVKDEN